MKPNIQLNKIQKFVIVETKEGILLWGNSDVKFHKEIIAKIQDAGITVLNVKGGGRIKVEDKYIYVWDKSSVYGEISFFEALNILNENFPEQTVLNHEPQG